MMDCSSVMGMGGAWMGWVGLAILLLVIALLGLAAAALVKYLRSEPPRGSEGG